MHGVSRVPQSKEPFRPEIQGLRTVAALLVAVYHIWFRRVSGGVDVFFVVSGFLMTGSIVRHIEHHGHVAFLNFWARLVARLLPAALTVIAITSIAVFFLMPRVLWGDSIREAMASAAYFENWLLAMNAVDYLAREETPSPFMHYWALSTQGQFYVLWPAVLALAARLARAAGRPARAGVPAALLVMFALSLTFSVIATRANQPFAYFNTLARVWEFALGGLVSVYIVRGNLPTGVRLVVGWVGLLAVVLCGFLFQVSQVFPGYAALWPTLAAALVLLGGTSGSRYGADRVLAARPLVLVGDISYAFYLWHWPVLVFFLAYSPVPDVPPSSGLAIILVSGCLAWLTTTYLEAPIRRGSARVTPIRTMAVAACCCAVLVSSLAAWGLYTRHLRREGQRSVATQDNANYPGARAIMNPSASANLAPLAPLPGPFAIKRDLPVSYRDGCHQDEGAETVHVCEYGRKEGRRTIALVGGSHSAQWLPALQVLAERYDLRILNATKSGCWLSDEERTDKASGGGIASCVRWNSNLLATLRRLRPDAIFTVLTRAVRDVDSTSGVRDVVEYVPDGYVAKFLEISRLGISIMAVRDNPWNRFDPAQCIDVFGASSPRCRMRRDEVLSRVNPADARKDLPAGMTTIDLSRFFCEDEYCKPVIGNVAVYRDKHHVSATYIRTLADALAPHLDTWIGSSEPATRVPAAVGSQTPGS